MAKTGTTPLEQTSRLLDLVPFLLSHQGISLADLAKYFKVETDVMLDDLNTLWMCGLPGYTPLELIDLAFDSGFVTIRNAAPLAYVRTMSSSEIVALALGLDLLRENSEKLGKEQSDRIEILAKKLRDQIGAQISISPSSNTAHRSVVSTAIARRVPVEMTYYSSNSDQETKRVVTAYDFFMDNDVEYFQGYCHSSQGMRTFRVDRIVAVSLSESVEVIHESLPSKSESIRVDATVRSLDRASAEAFGLVLGDLRLGGSVALHAFSPEWLIRSIIAGGGSLVVEGPQELALQIRQSIDSTMALYE
jgi:proteasome accessory factor C